MGTSTSVAFVWDGVTASCDCLKVASLRASGVAVAMVISGVKSLAEGALVSSLLTAGGIVTELVAFAALSGSGKCDYFLCFSGMGEQDNGT